MLSFSWCYFATSPADFMILNADTYITAIAQNYRANFAPPYFKRAARQYQTSIKAAKHCQNGMN
jgi:hypothetical protein